MATREKGRKKTKQEAPQEASQQYKVTDPISMADLEHMHTRRGKYPSQPPPFGPKTWELARKEKEEKGARPKDSLNRMSAFQDYTSTMMSTLNNPWKPRDKKTNTPT